MNARLTRLKTNKKNLHCPNNELIQILYYPRILCLSLI